MTGQDFDVDDIFAEMMREENTKISKVVSLHTNKVKASNEFLENKSTSSSSTSSPSLQEVTPSSEIESLLQQSPQQILQNLQRDINCLSSSEKGKRIGALKKLKSVFDSIESQKDQLPTVDYMKFFFSHIYQSLLKLFGNETEYCRETSVRLILTFTTFISVGELEEALPYLIPLLEERMRGPKEKFKEESEEVRLSLVLLMKSLIQKCTTKLEDPDYLQKIVNFVEKTYEDYHGVKAEGCQCTIILCQSLRETTIKLFSGSLIKKLIPHLKHQRFNVRAECLEAIKYLVIYGSVEPLEELHPHLRELCLDRSNVVRQKLLDVVVDWALNLRDKYSFQHNFVYYLVMLGTDEIGSISKSAYDYLIEIGKQYEEDYEDDVNETRMYDDNENTESKLTEYANPGRLPELPPVFTQRPLLGARLLAGKKHITKLVTFLLEDFKDWSLPRRVAAAKAMQICIMLAERNLTQHLDKILQTLFEACGDDEKDLKEESFKCVSLIGYFLEPETYLSTIYNYMKPEYVASPKFLSTVLNALASLLAHSDPLLLNRSLSSLLNKASGQHLIYCEDINVRFGLLNVLESCLSAGVKTVGEGLTIFLVILKLCSQPNTPEMISKRGLEVLQKEAEVLKVSNIEDVYAIYFEQALNNITSDLTSWDKLSPNFYSFEALLRNAPNTTITYFKKILEIFAIYLTPERDPIMLLRLLSVMNSLLYNSGSKIEQEDLYSILTQFVYPNSKWRNGRVYVDVRKAAISCFSCILRQKLCATPQTIQTFSSEFQFDNLMSCMDDDFDPHLRILVVKIMVDYIAYTYQHLTEKQWETLCTELRNRMEDENDTVRSITAASIAQLLLYLPAQMVDQANTIIFCLATHMDDSNSEIRRSCFNAFKTVIEQYKQNQHLEYVKHRLAIIGNQIHGFLSTAVHAKSDFGISYQTLLS